MTTATPKKKSPENKHLCYCDYFAIIPTCSNDTMSANYAETGLKGVPLKSKQKIKDLLLFAQVAVKTSKFNVVISRCCFCE